MTDILFLVPVFIFGTILGSFLNVVSLRFNTGFGLGGRSRCMSCGKKLCWWELVPVFSYLFLLGRCSKCRSHISLQYPLVELSTGLLFAAIFIIYPPLGISLAIRTVLEIFVACLAVVMVVYDIKHKVIPDQFVFAFIGLAFVGMFVGGGSVFHFPTWTQVIAGPLLALPFASIWYFSKGEMMGLGDAKLIVGIGWFVGLGAGINALILAFWIASVVSLIWLYAKYGHFKSKTEIPFGPYLILGMYLVILFKIRIIDPTLLKDIFWLYLL